MMVRNLPLREGYRKLLNLAVISTVQVAPYEIRVEAKDKVQAPFGEIECYKVVYSYKGLGPLVFREGLIVQEDDFDFESLIANLENFDLDEN